MVVCAALLEKEKLVYGIDSRAERVVELVRVVRAAVMSQRALSGGGSQHGTWHAARGASIRPIMST
jgi:hypothetical protein